MRPPGVALEDHENYRKRPRAALDSVALVSPSFSMSPPRKGKGAPGAGAVDAAVAGLQKALDRPVGVIQNPLQSESRNLEIFIIYAALKKIPLIPANRNDSIRGSRPR